MAKSVSLVGKQKHPDIQTKKRIHIYFSLIVFQASLELIRAVGRSLLLDFSFMADQAFFTGLRVRETTTLNEKTQNYVRGVSTNFSPCFSISASQISRYDMSSDL